LYAKFYVGGFAGTACVYVAYAYNGCGEGCGFEDAFVVEVISYENYYCIEDGEGEKEVSQKMHRG